MKRLVALLLVTILLAIVLPGSAEGYDYDAAYKLIFNSFTRYYLFDTSAGVVTVFTSNLDHGVETTTYTGVLRDGIEFQLGGNVWTAVTEYEGELFKVKSERSSADAGSMIDVAAAIGYMAIPEVFDDEILTIDNNEDLAEVLRLKDNADPKVKIFAARYANRIVSFDGNVAFFSYHGTYKTRYDILVYPGDYSEDTASGPSFQFSDVNTYDLGIPKSVSPGFVTQGSNIRVTAKVLFYNERSSLFMLDPVSTEPR